MALHSKCFTIITYYYYYYYENRVVLPSSTPLIQYTLYLFYQLFLYADNIHSAFQKNAAMGLPRRHTRSRTHTHTRFEDNHYTYCFVKVRWGPIAYSAITKLLKDAWQVTKAKVSRIISP